VPERLEKEYCRAKTEKKKGNKNREEFLGLKIENLIQIIFYLKNL
jgi:hypothetical protein